MSNLIDHFPDEYINACMEGTRLYGVGFSPEQIAAWHEREKEGYAELGAGDRKIQANLGFLCTDKTG